MAFSLVLDSTVPDPTSGLGDPDKVAQPRTTNRDTFQSPQPTTGSVYSRSTAVSGTLASSVHLGGTPQIDTFFTTVRDTFPCPVAQAGRKGQGNIERIPRNASFLPQGDLDAGRVKERISLSTTGTTHGVVSQLHMYIVHCAIGVDCGVQGLQ